MNLETNRVGQCGLDSSGST